MNETYFRDVFQDSIRCKLSTLEKCLQDILQVVDVITTQLKKGKKLLIFGNGGSAADAQHLASEFVNRLSRQSRPAIPAIALTTDTSILTSIANDSDFLDVFSRQIEALGQPGDIALGISTSGRSENIIRAIRRAHDMNLVTIGLLGCNGGTVASLTDYRVIVPSDSAQRIQETHILLAHAICESIENALFPEAGE